MKMICMESFLATKLKTLTRISKLKTKHEIDQLMFKFMLHDEENTLPTNHQVQGKEDILPTYQHREHRTFPSNSFSLASSPVYDPQNQATNQRSLPDIGATFIYMYMYTYTYGCMRNQNFAVSEYLLYVHRLNLHYQVWNILYTYILGKNKFSQE